MPALVQLLMSGNEPHPRGEPAVAGERAIHGVEGVGVVPDVGSAHRALVVGHGGCGGDGAGAAFEVVGAAAPVDLAIRCVRKGGHVVLVGNLQASVPFPLQEVVTRQITLHGSCSCAGEYPEAIGRIADGSIRVEPLLSAVVPLADGADWFARLAANKEGLLKVVLVP